MNIEFLSSLSCIVLFELQVRLEELSMIIIGLRDAANINHNLWFRLNIYPNNHECCQWHNKNKPHTQKVFDHVVSFPP